MQAIAAGNAEETAAEYAGIDRSTYFRWMQKGARRAGPYRDFRDAIMKARVEVEIAHVVIIEQAMAKSWQAAAWWLERRRNDRWGRREALDVTIRREAERLAQETGLDADEIIAEAERLVMKR